MNKNKKFCDKQYNNCTLNDNCHCTYSECQFGIEYVIVMTTVMAVVLVIEYFSR
ncbi:hypothetical phage protein [Campylobacter phage CP220]|uniref:Hypothetical phage protein n=1 Tax=Campylobacter phage CP220 TaxID=2994044 RepID=D5GV55_9CAUD|nr:hypothetical protein APL47_gp063 [Campylobacter phage CP220]CBJ93872.1 hypothetical phage protein [Campylobacter phage CP220]